MPHQALLGTALRESTFQMFLDGKLARNAGDYGHYMRCNHMTRVLCGAHLDIAEHDAGMPYTWRAESEQSSSFRLETLDARHLECAKRHLLKDFALVLVFDVMTEAEVAEAAGLIAARALHVPAQWIAEQETRTNHWPHDAPNQLYWDDVSALQRRQMEADNALDLDLYAFAQKLMRFQLAEWRASALLDGLDHTQD